MMQMMKLMIRVTRDNYKISWCIVKNDDNMITW